MSDRVNDKVRMKALLAAHLAYKKHILSGLKEYGIMPGHPKIMHYIMLHEGCRQKDIANNCYVESATLSSVLSNMERHGLIERRRSSDDKRSYTIYPKDSAKPIFDAVLDQFDKTESTALAGFTGKERNELEDYLIRIENNLKQSEGLL